MYLGSKPRIVPNKEVRVWDYELTDTNGEVWNVSGKKKRGGFRNGQMIMTEVQGRTANYIGKILTPAEFLHRIGEQIDANKLTIKNCELEIERLRAL